MHGIPPNEARRSSLRDLQAIAVVAHETRKQRRENG